MSHMRKSELSKWGLNELCCKRTVYRWNRLELNFPLMYGVHGYATFHTKIVVPGCAAWTVGPTRDVTVW